MNRRACIHVETEKKKLTMICWFDVWIRCWWLMLNEVGFTVRKQPRSKESHMSWNFNCYLGSFVKYWFNWYLMWLFCRVFFGPMTNPTHNIQGVEDKVRVQFPMVGWVVFSYWKKKGIMWQLHEFRWDLYCCLIYKIIMLIRTMMM